MANLGRKTFYTETFGNEVFFTEVTGILNGPLNIGNLTKAILALGGKQTTNLQVTLDRDTKVGESLRDSSASRTFTKGTILNTGLDVPAGSLIPLGIQTHFNNNKIRVGVTCAACHAAVDRNTGRILEGVPNNDLDTGLILALASNSAAWFRQTGVNPTEIYSGEHTYINAEDQEKRLPDAKALEDAVDTKLLTWPPGNFDSTEDNNNNPSQNPFSYTFAACPYGWSGNAAIGWFHGLTTLNSNVHGTNSDYQNTLAPPPHQATNTESVQHGAEVVNRAGCISCHSGRYFTNNHVIPEQQIKTQPTRAKAQAKFASIFIAPQTYPSNVPVPLPPNPAVLDVPTDITPEEDQKLAFAQGNAAGGYKVPSLIGLHVTAPYLHDGGVAASAEAIQQDKKLFKVSDRHQIGMAGTLLNGIQPDPSASLRVLLDRRLRKQVIAANRANPRLKQANVDGSGHN